MNAGVVDGEAEVETVLTTDGILKIVGFSLGECDDGKLLVWITELVVGVFV